MMSRAEVNRIEYRRKMVRYREKRAALLADLGGKCELCGVDDASKLEFDHPKGTPWKARKHALWVRINQYARDLADGNLRVLCGPCNKANQPPEPEPEELPF